MKKKHRKWVHIGCLITGLISTGSGASLLLTCVLCALFAGACEVYFMLRN